MVSIAVLIVLSLLGLIAARGMPHFWPGDVVMADYQEPGKDAEPLLAEIVETEEVSSAALEQRRACP